MLRRLLSRLRDWTDRDESRFVPSVLDASVRYAHGQGGDEGVRELESLSREAERLVEAADESRD